MTMDQVLPDSLYPWQHKLWCQLLRQLAQNRLPHALLISGEQGIGKSDFAESWAARLLCRKLHPGELNAACGQCKSCLLLAAGTHPDLIHMQPHEAGHPITIDQVREAGSWLVQTSQLGGYKILLLQLAEDLNLNAANALLKNLEEPVKDTLFIMVSSQPGRIAATIKSRCHHITMPVPEEKEARDWLSHQLQDRTKVELLLCIAGGAPLRAQQLSEEANFDHRQQVIAGLVDLCDRKVCYTEIADRWQSLDLLVTLGWVRLWLADLIKIVMTGGTTHVRNRDMLSQLQKIADKSVLDKLYLLDDRVFELRRALLSGHNPNKILLLEEILLRMQQCVNY